MTQDYRIIYCLNLTFKSAGYFGEGAVVDDLRSGQDCCLHSQRKQLCTGSGSSLKSEEPAWCPLTRGTGNHGSSQVAGARALLEKGASPGIRHLHPFRSHPAGALERSPP